MRAPLTARIEASEPVMVRIPEGWFWMGCEIGRDDEKPMHRVWVDAFELAAYQVTNQEYACFLAAMSYPQSGCWNDPNFNHPKMPVVAISWHEAVSYCEWLNRATLSVLSLASRSRVGTRSSRRCRTLSLLVGRYTSRAPSRLRPPLEERARASRSLSAQRLRALQSG